METFSRETSGLEPHWVTGFSDGEASFTYSRSGQQLALYYAVKLTDHERPLLEKLQHFFNGAGSLYEVKARTPRDRGGATKSAIYYRVSRRSDLPSVLEHFDAYPLQSAKKAVYDVWRMMVLAKQEFRRPDRQLLDTLAQRITDLCVRKQPWR